MPMRADYSLKFFSFIHVFDEIVASPIHGKQIFVVRNSLVSFAFPWFPAAQWVTFSHWIKHNNSAFLLDNCDS